MIDASETIVYLQALYRTIQSDFEKQNVDLYFLKSRANALLTDTSNFKMNENINFSRFDQEELVKLLADIRKLISAIKKEIEIQENEEFFNSNISKL